MSAKAPPPCTSAPAPRRDGARTCGFAVPDPGGMDAEGLLLSAWTEAVFAGEAVTAAGLAEAIARHCHARGEPGLARAWMRRGRAHMRGLH